jgi:hypothetical protein
VFVFSRRAIQRRIDELGNVLSTSQLEGLVKRINRVGRERFALSWEACLLHALSRVGAVSYEAPLPDWRRPDISFTYPGEDTVGFIADVTAISDEGYHNANPVEILSDELTRLARAVGLDPNHLDWKVGGHQDGAYGFQKTKLRLPPGEEIPVFLNTRILPFLEKIRNEAISKDEMSIEDDRVSLTICYDVSQRFMGGGHLAYNVALSLKKNPLWTKLVNKADHFKRAAEIAPFGIIACDGGCSLFHRKSTFGTFTCDDIIWKFFREKPFVSFVLLLSTRDIDPFPRYERTFRIEQSFYSPRQEAETSRLRAVLADALARLPKPVLDPLNAYIQCREDSYRCGRFGVYHVTGTSVKISARTILELLAGRRTPSEINESFERRLQQGRMITGIRVEKSEDESDDDRLIIEFGEPDPAISPFVVKPKLGG